MHTQLNQVNSQMPRFQQVILRCGAVRRMLAVRAATGSGSDPFEFQKFDQTLIRQSEFGNKRLQIL